MSGRTFLDTNVLAYAFDAADDAKRRVAERVLTEAGPGTLVLSAQVLNEFYVVATRKLGIPAEMAARAVDSASRMEIVPLDVALVQAGIDRCREARLSLWDALIIEAARRAGCDRVLTEDLSDGEVIGGVRVEDPFARAS